MPYFYKRPGDWLWHPHETDSLAEDVESGRLQADWRYRLEGNSKEYKLAELLEAERVQQSRVPTPAEEELTAPDGTWGMIVVVAASLFLLFLLLVPVRQGAGGSKLYLAGFALVGLGRGIEQIRASRAWKAQHRSTHSQTR